MPKILIIDNCWDCPMQYFDADEGSDVCDKTKKHIPITQIEIPEWCPLEEEDNKLRAKWFEKGQMSIKRKNKSGCCCIIDEDLGDKVVSVCGAHQTWMEEQCQQSP